MALAPIPLKVAIVDKAGQINIFFRQRWEELRLLTSLVAAKTIYTPAAVQSAAIVGQLLYTVTQGGLYRVTFTTRRTTVDGAASSLTFTWHWTDSGSPLSDAAPVNNTDTVGSLYTGTRTFPVDANTNLTFDMGYTSTTPGQMKYKPYVTVEQVAQA